MGLELKYNQVYDLRIAGEDCKGVYLGKRIPRSKRPKSRYVILVNKSSNKLSLHSYSLVVFTDYRLNEDKKLILQRMHYINPASRERNYLEELCQKFA